MRMFITILWNDWIHPNYETNVSFLLKVFLSLSSSQVLQKSILVVSPSARTGSPMRRRMASAPSVYWKISTYLDCGTEECNFLMRTAPSPQALLICRVFAVLMSWNVHMRIIPEYIYATKWHYQFQHSPVFDVRMRGTQRRQQDLRR